MKNLTLFLIALLFCRFVPAQENGQKPAVNSIAIIFENGLLAGHPEGVYPLPFSSHLVLSSPIGERLFIGGGAGAEIIGKTFVPLYADIRVIPFHKKPLFLYGKAGYSLCLNNTYNSAGETDYIDSNYYPYYPGHRPHPLSNDYITRGGILVESGVGVLFRGKTWATGFSIGYRYQQTEDVTTYLEHERTYQNYFHRLALRLSFWF